MAMTCYADAPAEYFGGRTAASHYLPHQEQESLQLNAMQRRFTVLRDRIVPLKALAAERLNHAYGMTEITTHFNMCDHGRYHVPPWIVPMVVDPASGALQPRKGKQKGLPAFMDLLPQTFWGGVVSADMVDVSWDGCGRTTPTVEPTISRTPLPEGEAHLPSPASADALHAAAYTLNRDIG